MLKRQRAGIIVQFSLIGGRVGGTAGLRSYQAQKFAVDGSTRVLASETAPFGTRYITVEPGGFATDRAGASMQIRDMPIHYERTVGAILRLTDTDVVKAGDTERAAELPVRVVKRRNLDVHLLLGVFAVDAAQNYSRRQLAEADGWREVSTSAEFHRPYPIELPPENPADQSAH